MVITRNRLVPVLSLLIVGGVLFFGLRGCGDREPAAPVLKEVPPRVNPEADTPADTIQTLTANVRRHDGGAGGVAPRERSAVSGQRRLGRRPREHRTFPGRSDASRSQRPGIPNSRRVSLHNSRPWDSLRQRLDQVAISAPSWPGDTRDIPLGFGFDLSDDPSSPQTLHWMRTARCRVRRRVQTGPAAWSVDCGPPRPIRSILPIPVYTVPRNATLLDARVMTALVGRVPLGRRSPGPAALQGHHRRR